MLGGQASVPDLAHSGILPNHLFCSLCPRDSREWPVISFTHDKLILQGNCSLPNMVRVILAALKEFVASLASVHSRHLISEESSRRAQAQGSR